MTCICKLSYVHVVFFFKHNKESVLQIRLKSCKHIHDIECTYDPLIQFRANLGHNHHKKISFY